MIDTRFYNFDAAWIVGVMERAVLCDPYLQERPELVDGFKSQILSATPISRQLNRDFEHNVNFYFINPKNANQPRAAWQFETNISFYGDTADLILDVMKDGSIGSIEIWHHKDAHE